ncbi:prolipoprotein diacylglyceryl transferase [Streptomyces pluripotens]|uniref:Phosphatidylglycerol--prolipoprotein diacylglyceryl transferase n=1 Tax=Streptomyces pluripotens TaxID=1355015 RepID=A0A221NVK2_9ACTN|nr:MULTISPECIES: prolipoprotein diacylglyceryl transferase [Streptomyces]ARP69744.1 prolipoprotein diacylglyceryl transferase [Streptomyces pluripotens]ASN24001.1 prolipoprotein diacylglyceryl transferase [Streptomyces pluripotens]KIE24130.1 diacylglyceryl transferase [Streptomyces sp. MUSC 125]MCH0555759.1 prolipoprotein diacylglyceryl transferase [Streptomyces sp. MUM 16J]
MELAYIPSPSRGVLYLGPIPLRGYAFCIIIGVFIAVWVSNKRWIARGGQSGTVADIAVWAVPFGLVGGRLYHVITDYELYFSDGRDWVDAFKVWQGGLGIWGAVALGALGAWIGARRRGIPLPAYADAVAPGIAFAQAMGRWGNWFNQELYGRETHVPWALHITSSEGGRVPGYYHPTFLYESLWCIGVGFLVIWADRRFKLGHGRAFALYVAAYCVGRAWIEYMRVDDAHHILGLRLNDWTALFVFLMAVLYMVVSAKTRPGREAVVEPAALGTGGDGAAVGATVADGAGADTAENKDTSGPGDTAQAKDTSGAGDPPQRDDPAGASDAEEATDTTEHEARSAKKS